MKLKEQNWIVLSIITLIILVGFLMFEIKDIPVAKWKENYLYNSKEPNGAFVFKEMLTTRFPKVPITELSTTFDLEEVNDTNQLYILFGNKIHLNDDLSESLFSFVEEGNQALLIGNSITLGNDFSNEYPHQYTFLDSSVAISYNHSPQDTFLFKYYWESFNSAMPYLFKAFSAPSPADYDPDSSYLGDSIALDDTTLETLVDSLNAIPDQWQKDTTISSLENSVEEDASLFTTAGIANGQHSIYQVWPMLAGEIHYHSIPMLFSNQAAMQPGYREHFNLIFSKITPEKIWLDHMSWHAGDEADSESPLQYILSEKSLKTAYYLLIIGVLVYIIFNSKRRQRIIPPVELNKNTTLEYLQTVSKLYLSQENHIPIINYLREGFYHQIKKSYYLERHHQDFAQLLTKKSQIDINQVMDLLAELEKSKKYPSVRPTYPIVIYQKIYNFFKKAK